MEKDLSITHDIANNQLRLFYPNAKAYKGVIEASVEKQIYPLTLMAAHKMPKFVVCAVIPYHETLLGRDNADGSNLRASWFNTQFAPQFIAPPFEFQKTFTKEDAVELETDLGMLKSSLELIAIVFPMKFDIELKDNRIGGEGTISYSAKYAVKK